jgi:histidine ammonia-lyase
MSSSALTIGRACLAWQEASRWTAAAHAIAALSAFALDGSTEPFHPAVHELRPHPSITRSAAIVRALLAGQRIEAARIQDPYAVRCIPQVNGAALEALAAVERILQIEVNVASENPLIIVSAADEEADQDAGPERREAVYHHGGFHQALLTQTLDALNLALLSVGQLSLARLDLMFHPEFTDLRPFLADGEPASSGVMILENAAHDALSELRNAAMPAGLGHATLSRGVEDHTPFTSQSARQTARAGDALQLVLATELVGALRTLRLRDRKPASGTPLAEIYAIVEVLDPRTIDRPSTADVHHATSLLPQLADSVAETERAGLRGASW